MIAAIHNQVLTRLVCLNADADDGPSKQLRLRTGCSDAVYLAAYLAFFISKSSIAS
jgi:hypothetical protein